MPDPPDARRPAVAVPPQPVLRDGPVVLRPWRVEDAEQARLRHDEEIRTWFDFPVVIPPLDRQLEAVQQWQADYADGRRVVSFLVERDGEIAGTVEVRRREDGVGRLSWALFAGHRGRGTATRAVRLLVDYAFTDLGLDRVEALVHPANTRSLRLAGRSGLRREGLLRQEARHQGGRVDMVLLARLADDPAPGTAEAFFAMLNASLPRKRAIAQGVLRDPDGRVLLCEQTYKPEWDLPGGVVELGESPRAAAEREVAEELGIRIPARGLLAVNWLPPWTAWEDACTFLFDLGRHDPDIAERMSLQPTEIAAVHWCDRDRVAQRATQVTAAVLARLWEHEGEPLYLEAGADPAYR